MPQSALSKSRPADSHGGAGTSSYSEADALAMIRLRYWQHLINEMLKAKQFKVPIHLAFGHEAAAVAMDGTMQSEDVLCLTHRNGAYNLARSKSLAEEIAYYRLEPRADGTGQMGSQNLAMPNTGIAYSSSILGNNIAVGAGIAINRKLLRRPGVVFVTTGDGAIEEGVFWESLVFARSHSLAMVIVVENNNFSLASRIEERRCPIDLSLVCSGLCVSYRHVGAARLPDVKDAMAAARADASDGNPAVIELDVKTFNQHAGSTPGWPEDPTRIALEDGLMLGEDPADPIVQLFNAIGPARFGELADQILREHTGV